MAKKKEAAWTVVTTNGTEGFKGVYDLKNKEQALDLSNLLSELGVGSHYYVEGYYDKMFEGVKL